MFVDVGRCLPVLVLLNHLWQSVCVCVCVCVYVLIFTVLKALNISSCGYIKRERILSLQPPVVYQQQVCASGTHQAGKLNDVNRFPWLPRRLMGVHVDHNPLRSRGPINSTLGAIMRECADDV